MKHFTLIIVWVLLFNMVNGQSTYEALTFNQHENLGTARTMGMAGAFNGLGADPYATYYNPANAVYLSQNNISITPYLGVSHSAGVENGYIDLKSNFSIGGLHFIFNASEKAKWFINFQREADYHSLLSDNYNGSLMNHWTDLANSQGVQNAGEIYEILPFSSALAYDTYLLNFDDANQTFVPIVTDTYSQSRTITTSGRRNVWSGGYAKSINEKLAFGVNLNIPVIRYSENAYLTEGGQNDVNDLRSLELREETEIDGVGLNLKAGVAYSPTQQLRISAAYQTPGIHWMTQTWSSEVTANFINDPTTFISEQTGSFDYFYFAPHKLDLGIGAILAKKVAVDLDYTLLSPQASRFVSNNAQFSLNEINDEVKSNLQVSHQIRAGVEGRINNFFIRTGASYQTASLSTADLVRNDVIAIGAGIGFNKTSSRFDLGVLGINRETSLGDYAPFETLIINRTITETKLVASWSFRF